MDLPPPMVDGRREPSGISLDESTSRPARRRKLLRDPGSLGSGVRGQRKVLFRIRSSQHGACVRDHEGERLEACWSDENAAEPSPALNPPLAERSDQRCASTSGLARCAGRSPRSHASMPSTIMADWCLITSRLAPPI